MKNYRILIHKHDMNTTENTILDNYFIEKIEAENEAEAVALYADYFFHDHLDFGCKATIDNEKDEVTVNNNFVYWFEPFLQAC